MATHPRVIIENMIDVLRAHKNGYKIQWRPLTHAPVSWEDTPNPGWDFQRNEYRIKPIPREFWIVKYPFGNSLRASSTQQEALQYIQDASTELIRVREVER